jgi:hypothetical protein
VQNWYIIYLNFYATNTWTNKNATLKDEWDDFQKKIGGKESSALREKLFSDFSVDQEPFEITEQAIRMDLGFSYKEWQELGVETRGQMMAINTMQSQKATLSRFYDELRSARNSSKKK